MNQLRSRLLLAFLAATLLPLALAIWLTSALLEHSLSLTAASTRNVDELSQALEATGRELYRQGREQLRSDASSGRLEPERFALASRGQWPPEVAAFWDSGEVERFLLTGDAGDTLRYLVRAADGVRGYSRAFGKVRMDRLSELYARARQSVTEAEGRDLSRGFQYTLLLAVASMGVVTVIVLIFFAHRISRPVRRLTTALGRLAAGALDTRVETTRDDEIGAALAAFNHMADQLEQSRERLVLLTRLSSWQAVGRKMAHEVKNSLTPIRLTVEEMSARHAPRLAPESRAFFDQAAQIIIDEVTRLERQVRAFSDLASEPPVNVTPVEVNAIVSERMELLRSAHPGVGYQLRLSGKSLFANADADLLRGVLTNLLENAAEAAGPGGTVLGVTSDRDAEIHIEVHDSGPGLSEQARKTLFQPTISSKPGGMGLGLSIAHKSAMLSGGDILQVPGELGGAGFRVVLPPAAGAKSSEEEALWLRSGS